MRFKTTFSLFATAVFIVGSSGPASAATTWQLGDAISAPDPLDIEVYVNSWSGEARCDWDTNAEGAIKRSNDSVFVKDTCGDGRSAVVMVTTTTGSNQGDRRICRNARGAGKWARCDWNWPEGEVYELTAGVYNGDTGYLKWDYGAGKYFND